MMDRITLIDSASNKRIPIGSNPPIVASSGAGWVGFRLEHHLNPPKEVEGVTFTDYGVCVELNREGTAPALLEALRRGAVADLRGPLVSVVPPLAIIGAHRWADHLETLHLHLDASFVSRVADETADSTAGGVEMSFSAENETMASLALMLKAELTREVPHGRLYAENLAVAFTVCMLKNFSGTRFSTPRYLAKGLVPFKRRRVIEYIRENLAADLSLSEVAEVAGLSRYHFARLFKVSTGVTPHRFIQMQRLEAAKRMLMDQNLSIGEICSKVGFRSQSQFAAFFRSSTGLTPTRYRERL